MVSPCHPQFSRANWWHAQSFFSSVVSVWKRYYTLSAHDQMNSTHAHFNISAREIEATCLSTILDTEGRVVWRPVVLMTSPFSDSIVFSVHTGKQRFQNASFSNGSTLESVFEWLRFRRCSVDDSRIRSKTAPFSFENGLVWTGPQAKTIFELEKGVNNLTKSASFEKEWSNAHRLGKQNANGEKLRPIIAKSSFYTNRELIPSNARILAGTVLGISQHFPQEIMEIRRGLVKVFKEAEKEGRDAILET